VQHACCSPRTPPIDLVMIVLLDTNLTKRSAVIMMVGLLSIISVLVVLTSLVLIIKYEKQGWCSAALPANGL